MDALQLPGCLIHGLRDCIHTYMNPYMQACRHGGMEAYMHVCVCARERETGESESEGWMLCVCVSLSDCILFLPDVVLKVPQSEQYEDTPA